MERIQILEDRQEILELLMTHPLAVDGGGTDFWLSKWTEDSLVDRPYDPEHHSGAYQGVYGKDVMHQEAQSPELAALRKTGICHFVTSPAIRLAGDAAHASNYLQLFTLEGKSYRLRFIVISRWELRREHGEWKITKRVIRPVGDEETTRLALASLPSQHT